jgi:hypothetical protein
MKNIAGMVPRIIKSLTKVSGERKVNMQKIKAMDELSILASTAGFFRQRFNAEVSVFSEDDNNRIDPKNRAAMALPYQPAIYIE